MLGKLIKNDFKASAHSLLPIYLIAFAVGVVTALSYAFESLAIIQAIGTFVLLLLSFAILIIPVFLILSYFNKSLYSNQGYLSYTIPARSRDILFSKAVVSFSWITLGFAMYIAIYVFVIKYFFGKMDPSIIEQLEALYDMIEALPEKSVLFKVIIAVIVVFFFEILVIVSQIFFSITLSNIKPFNQLGNAGGFLIFVAVFVVMFYIFIQLTQYFPLSLFFSSGNVKIITEPMQGTANTVIGVMGVVFQLICSAAMFVGTNYLMKKKINIR